MTSCSCSGPRPIIISNALPLQRRDLRIDKDRLSSIDDQGGTSYLVSDIQVLQLEYWSIDSGSLAGARRTDVYFLATGHFSAL